jgi:acyl-CoA synthetase (NDP forming)
MAPEGSVPVFSDVRHDEAVGLLATALAELGPDASGARKADAIASGQDDALAEAPSRWLRPDEIARLLACYGIPVADWRMARTPAEAGAAADELGGPVALKAVATGVVRKREAGAVALGLEGAVAVERAGVAMVERLAAAGHPVERLLVQRMVEGGTEMLVGVVHDRLFGPVIACGAGDAELQLLRDVVVRITPLTDRDATEMLRSLAIYPLLDGVRAGWPADIAALEEVLLRVSALVEAHPEIVEMDCNPVIVLREGAVVVDARIRIEAPARG